MLLHGTSAVQRIRTSQLARNSSAVKPRREDGVEVPRELTSGRDG